MKSHNKITTGFVIQKYVTLGGKHICVGQEFVAGDQVNYEDLDGEPIDIDDLDGEEQYQPFDMKYGVVGTDGLKFSCPKCHYNRLECIEDGHYSSEVRNIDKDGDFDFGEIYASGEVQRFQCMNCGYVLKNVEDNTDNIVTWEVTEHTEVVEWIEKNCSPQDCIGCEGKADCKLEKFQDCQHNPANKE